MTGRRNPNLSTTTTTTLMPPPRPLTLTLILALVLPALSDDLPSSSPSPSPSPVLSRLPPEHARFDSTGIRLPPPAKPLHNPPQIPPAPGCPSVHLHCHRSHHHSSLPGHERRLNFGQLMGIVFAGIAAALQVVLGAFLVYKRVQLTKAERRGRGLVATSPRSSF